jgi:hypothetical protein
VSEPTGGIEINLPVPPSIESVLDQHLGARPPSLAEALVEREEQIADILRIVGVQWGVLPPIMAEVFAQIGLGRPISTEQRALIHSQFHRAVEAIQRGDDPYAPPTTDN